MLLALIAICAGLLLLADSLGKYRGLDALIRWLRPYSTIIGVIALIAGVLHFFSLLGIALILGGIILAAGALVTVPRVGDEFGGVAQKLTPFATIIGVIVVVLGILRFL